jgi:nitrogen fixation protein FixH
MTASAPESSAKDAASHHAERRQRVFWVGLVLTLLGGQMVLIGTMAYVAMSDGSLAIEPDYYQRGLHWDETAAQIRRNGELGWSLRLQVGDQVNVRGERVLRCRLNDKTGRALDGATMDLVTFSHARGNQRFSATLLPMGGGEYETTLHFSHPGVWEFRLIVQRGPETFTQTSLRDITPPGVS